MGLNRAGPVQPGSGNDANSHGTLGAEIVSYEELADNGGGYGAWRSVGGELAAGNEGSGDIVVDGFSATRSFDLSIGDPTFLEEAIALGSVHPTLPPPQRPETHSQPRRGQAPR